MKITTTVAVSQRSQIQHSGEVIRKGVEASLASYVFNDVRSGRSSYFSSPANRIRSRPSAKCTKEPFGHLVHQIRDYNSISASLLALYRAPPGIGAILPCCRFSDEPAKVARKGGELETIFSHRQ